MASDEASNQDIVERLNAALTDRYRIDSELGSGGMATVYLAQDLRHDRQVAVKVLQPELAAVVGTERFLAEIRTTANLTHPHILPLHDSGEADGFLFYVMPYVTGESLRERLDREGQLPVEEAVRIAGRVAEALDHAHRQNVIHRDIKPANILFQDDEPVVADFGIALAVSAAGEGRLTETGLSLGTPYYMSPEQAAGEETPTAASDVYSLGCVLYEMLTGDPPHTGSSAQAILGKILLGEVTRPTKLRRTIPANVEGVILKALERLPADRFASTADLAAALKDKGFRHGVGAAAATGGAWKGVAIGATAVAVLLLGLVLKSALTPDSLPPVRRHTIQPPSEYHGVTLSYFAVAPDGSSIVYRDNVGLDTGWELWVKELESGEARPLTGGERYWDPKYSPDGRWIAYRAPVEGVPSLVKRPIQGAGTTTILEGVQSWELGLDWLPDGTILCEQTGGALVRVSEDGGTASDTVVASGPDISWVHGLPGESAALFVTCPGERLCRTSDLRHLNVVDLEADTSWLLLEEARKAWYVPSGHMVWLSQNGEVFATPFDLESLEMGSPHTPLLEGVRGSQMEMSQEGTVYYVEGEGAGRALFDLVWVDREGQATLVDPALESDEFYTPVLSPDGRRLAITIGPAQFTDLWVKDMPDGPLVRLTTTMVVRRPAWSLGGDTLAFSADTGVQRGLWQIRAIRSDGSSVDETELLLAREVSVFHIVYAPDGDGLLFREGNANTGAADLGYLDFTTGEVEALVATDFNEHSPTLSPDGRWLAYTSDRTGEEEVWVRPFPEVESGSWRVSRNGGTEPVWAHNGRELFFRDGEGWMTAATYSTDPAFQVQGRERLFDATPFRSQTAHQAYQVDLDDERFLMVQPVDIEEDSTSPPRLIMIQNFFTLVEERVGGR